MRMYACKAHECFLHTKHRQNTILFVCIRLPLLALGSRFDTCFFVVCDTCDDSLVVNVCGSRYVLSVSILNVGDCFLMVAKKPPRLRRLRNASDRASMQKT